MEEMKDKVGKCIFCFEESKDPHHLLVCESMVLQEAEGGSARIVICPINFSKCKRRLIDIEVRPPGNIIF